MDKVHAVLCLKDRGGIPPLFPEHFDFRTVSVADRLDRLKILGCDPDVFIILIPDEVDLQLFAAGINDPAGVPITVAITRFRSLADAWIR